MIIFSRHLQVAPHLDLQWEWVLVLVFLQLQFHNFKSTKMKLLEIQMRSNHFISLINKYHGLVRIIIATLKWLCLKSYWQKTRSLGWPSKTSSHCKQIPKNSNVYNFQKSFFWEYRTSLKTEVGNFLQDTYAKSIYSFYFDSFKLWQKLLPSNWLYNSESEYMFKLKKLMKFSFPDQSYWVTSFIYSKILFFSQLANIRYNIFMYFWRISWPTVWTPVNNDISGAIYGSEFRMPSYSLRGWSFPIGPAFDRNCLRSCLWTCRGK